MNVFAQYYWDLDENDPNLYKRVSSCQQSQTKHSGNTLHKDIWRIRRTRSKPVLFVNFWITTLSYFTERELKARQEDSPRTWGKSHPDARSHRSPVAATHGSSAQTRVGILAHRRRRSWGGRQARGEPPQPRPGPSGTPGAAEGRAPAPAPPPPLPASPPPPPSPPCPFLLCRMK